MLAKALPWIARASLLFAAIDFGTVGTLYFLSPIGEAANSTITAAEAAGVTNIRVGFGVFHLGLGLIAIFCLLKPQRIILGLALVCAMPTTAILVRLFGLMVDGWHERTVLLLQLECLGLVIFATGLWAERRRLKALHA